MEGIGTEGTSRAQIILLVLERTVEAAANHDPVLPWTHIELPDHAHLQVLWRRDVAVPEIRAGIRCEVVIREAAADIDGD